MSRNTSEILLFYSILFSCLQRTSFTQNINVSCKYLSFPSSSMVNRRLDWHVVLVLLCVHKNIWLRDAAYTVHDVWKRLIFERCFLVYLCHSDKDKGPSRLMKKGLSLILVGHITFILGAIVHGNVLRHISRPSGEITTEYTAANIISVTSGLLVSRRVKHPPRCV